MDTKLFIIMVHCAHKLVAIINNQIQGLPAIVLQIRRRPNYHLDQGRDGSIGGRHHCLFTLEYSMIYSWSLLTLWSGEIDKIWTGIAQRHNNSHDTRSTFSNSVRTKVEKSDGNDSLFVVLKQLPWSDRCTWSASRPLTCPRTYLQCSPEKEEPLETDFKKSPYFYKMVPQLTTMPPTIAGSTA